MRMLKKTRKIRKKLYSIGIIVITRRSLFAANRHADDKQHGGRRRRDARLNKDWGGGEREGKRRSSTG